MILDFNRIHPELEDGEVFLVNVLDPARFSPLFGGENYFITCPYQTKRLGKISYDKCGNVEKDFLPIFVRRSELESLGIDLEDPFNFPRGRKVEEEPGPSFNETHPELREGEIFLFNASDISPYPDEDPWILCSLRTKRRGRHAYRRDGASLSHSYPVFAMRWEIEAEKRSFEYQLQDVTCRFFDWVFSWLERLEPILDRRLEKRILKRAQKIKNQRR